jgi:hypothetical protein
MPSDNNKLTEDFVVNLYRKQEMVKSEGEIMLK